MNIQSIKAYLVKLPLTKSYKIAYKDIEDTEIVFLEIGLSNGLTGIGAANPFEEVVGETPAQTLLNLQSNFVDGFIGKDIRCFRQLIQASNLAFPHQPGTIAAIDIALHDLFGKYLEIPILSFYGQKIKPLPTSITIGIKETAEMIEDALEYKGMGFKALKIKTGLSVEQDIERVSKLAEKFGNDMRIRVDANQGYSLENLTHFMKATAHLQLELIEQPLPVGKENELLNLTEKERNVLVADESLLEASSAQQLLHSPQPFGVFNIKLMKSGGLLGAFEIANLAYHSGVQLFWGCNDESIVSISAALHAAYACPNTAYLDLDGSFDIAKDLVSEGFQLKDGYLFPTNLPGFGFKRLP